MPTTYNLTVTVTDDAVALAGVQVVVQQGGTTLFEQATNSSGVAIFALLPGTYQVIAGLAGYTISGSPATVSMVSANTSLALSAGLIAPGVPSALSMCRVYGWLTDAGNNPVQVQDAAVFRLLTIPASAEHIGLTRDTISAGTDVNGYWFADLVWSSAAAQVGGAPGEYQMTIDALGIDEIVIVPDLSSVAYDALVAPTDAPIDPAPESW
jgi:hypothetical protein